jgi:N-acetylmuramoyl-L-alanine amidase
MHTEITSEIDSRATPPRRRVRRPRSRRRRRVRLLRTLPVALALLVGAAAGYVASRSVPSKLSTASSARPLDPLRTPPQKYDWTRQPPPEFPIPPYARFLSGVLIVLDPGHVGQRDRPNWKRGPTGLREAEVNLRVAQYLREFLAAVGAKVQMTREVDRSLDVDDDEDLRQRAQVANAARADLLLSIHHNAGPADANYTTLYYHKSADDSRASVCAARFLLTGLSEALRLEQHVDNALRSDYQQYPGKGFAVLREARVPAVLSESSFHSNPQQEERLRDPVYNRREAYGLFLGLARWAQAGLPRVTLVEPTDGRLVRGKPIVVRVDDGFAGRGGLKSVTILEGSLRVRLNGEPADFEFDASPGVLRIKPPASLLNKPARLHVDFENLFGQHVLHPDIELKTGR